MKIIRYQDSAGTVHLGQKHDDGSVTRLQGTLFDNPAPTSEPAEVSKLLAPLVPTDIICIGLNYRKHAAESGKPAPEFPVMFMKNTGALQHPGDAIALPRHLRSDAVDYELRLLADVGSPSGDTRTVESRALMRVNDPNET